MTDFYTVEEASQWLSCKLPLPRAVLSKLGRDCSMVCRIKHLAWVDRPVIGKDWPTERAYPAEVIREAFSLNPATATHVPKA